MSGDTGGWPTCPRCGARCSEFDPVCPACGATAPEPPSRAPASTTRDREIEPSRALDPTGLVFVDRYRLASLLGRGGQCEVWAADDLLTGATVAVKLLGEGHWLDLSQARREILALRHLHLPGVVTLLDEGSDHGRAFLVMERVAGAPFPGLPLPCPWPAMAGATVSLLEALRRVHAAGVVHRDLKPGNVLVDARGRATVLDLGLALDVTPGSDEAGNDALAGTPLYLAPEQILGDRLTPRADLYAVGVMLYQALAGHPPHPVESIRELLRTGRPRRAHPLREVAPDVPPGVAAVIDALLAHAPLDRPASAAAVLAALPEAKARSRALPRLGGDPPGAPLTEADLRPLFAGPDRIFHLREDAARALHERTSGVPARVAAEIAAWCAAGLAQWDGDQLAVDRPALDRLAAYPGPLAAPDASAPPSANRWTQEEREAGHRAAAHTLAPGTPGRLSHLLLGAGAPAELAGEALEAAGRLAREGHLAAATVTLGEALFAVRRAEAPDPALEIALLTLWTDVALTDRSPLAMDRALYELSRSRARTPETTHLAELLRASLARGAGGERALHLAESVAPFADPRLERHRQAVRVVAARRCSAEKEEEVLADVARWAERDGSAEAAASLAGWLGRIRYRQERYDEAAALQARAVTPETWATDRINALLNEAAARMEGFRFAEAAAQAGAARDLAARCRHPYFEARAAQLQRALAYRAGEALAPDVDLCQVLARTGVAEMEALPCLTEAALAWRSGQRDLGAALAERARRVWESSGWRVGVLLARPLAILCGSECEAVEVHALAEEALSCSMPLVALQSLGLLALARGGEPGWREAAEPWAEGVPHRHRQARMDVLSAEEALAALTGSGDPARGLERRASMSAEHSKEGRFPFVARIARPDPHEQIIIGEYVAFQGDRSLIVARIYVDYDEAQDQMVEHWVFLDGTADPSTRPVQVARLDKGHESLAAFLADLPREQVARYTITRAAVLPAPSPGDAPLRDQPDVAVLADGGYRVFQRGAEVGAIVVEDRVEHWGVARGYDMEIGFDLEPCADVAQYDHWAEYVREKFDGGIHWAVTSVAGKLP